MTRSRPRIVVMGVSGSGKSTVGGSLAAALGTAFVEGDDLHSQANISKMRRGLPLDDADRAPWLAAIRFTLADVDAYPAGVVVACSALRRIYRDVLRGAGNVRFVFLAALPPLIERRLERRAHHFMPRSLIGSQFEALEAPSAAERDALTIDAALSVQDAVRLAVAFIRGPSA